MQDFNALPAALRPTPEVIARDNELARQAKEIVSEITGRIGLGVKAEQEGYNAVTFGADGRPVSRIVNGVSQMTPEEEAVARAQSAAQAQINRMEAELARVIADRDEITGFEPDGTPRYVRSEQVRQALEGQARSLRLGIVNQMRLNERRWRAEAAPAVQKAETYRAIEADLRAQGKVSYASTL